MCTLKGMPTLDFTTRKTAPHIARCKRQARGRVGGLQPTPYHVPLKCMPLNRQCQHGKSTNTRCRHHKQPNIEEASHHKEPHHNNPYNSQNLEQKGNCSHMPPRTSMANITAHALPSGDGEKMRIELPYKRPKAIRSGKTETPTLLPTHLSREKQNPPHQIRRR